MKHSIRTITLDYTVGGNGKEIEVTRGLDTRHYMYNSRRVHWLNLLTYNFDNWQSFYYDVKIIILRRYPEQ